MEIIKRSDSTNIDTVEYNPDKQEMFIRFKSGGYYKYSTVPEHVFRSFKNVDSAGHYFATAIRGKYPYTRIRKYSR